MNYEYKICIPTTIEKLADLKRRNEETQFPVGKKVIDKIHSKGKLTARERILSLLDNNSFVELDALARHRSNNFNLGSRRPLGDGVITGYGLIDNKNICIFSQDSTVFGGSLGEVYGEKIAKVQELAIKTGCPLIGINDGAGARIQEGVASLGSYSRIFLNNIKASGVIPQISLIMGPAAGGHVYSPALTDFIIMVNQTSQMFITGPDVIKSVTGEDVTMNELGGACTHMVKSGTAHYIALNEPDAFDYVHDLLSYLPENNCSEPPSYSGNFNEIIFNEEVCGIKNTDLDTLIPDSPNQPYDMHELINYIIDDELLETQSDYATNVIVGFGRIDGKSIGIIANQPTQFAGCLDINASEKAARFIRTCDCFNIPIVLLVDVPGFLPGTEQEYNGIIRCGAKLLYAYGEATIPKITVVIRKSYGGAYCVMGSKNMGADLVVAWPTAQIAVMGASSAIGFVYRQQIKEAINNNKDVDVLRLQLQQNYENTLLNPYIAAELGYVDAVIQPSKTRKYISNALKLLKHKIVQMPSKKHGNIPL